MINRIRWSSFVLSWFLAALLGAVLALGGVYLLRGGESEKERLGISGLPEMLFEKAYAAEGKGEYLFLPNRRSMWVVNKINGRIIQYQLFDNQVGTVQRSRVGQIDTENFFPVEDTVFMLSDRNLTSFLWVGNRATGEFQIWRSSRDGTLTTDLLPVPAGEHLRNPPVSTRNPRAVRER